MSIDEKDGGSTLTVKDAYDILSAQTESAHKLWTYFSVVSVAVLGYTVGNKDNNWSWPLYLVIIASYVGFAVSNLWVLRQTQRECVQCGGVLQAIAQRCSGPEQALGDVSPVPVQKVTAFHVCAQVAVVVAIAATWANAHSTQPTGAVAGECHKSPCCGVPAAAAPNAPLLPALSPSSAASGP